MLSNNGEGKVTFVNFASLFVAMRHFFQYSDGLFLSYDKFKEFLASNKCPGRLKSYVEHTYIPTEEEINRASSQVFPSKSDANYFGKYNNLIFLQKSQKSRMGKAPEDFNIEKEIPKMEYPTESSAITFEMFNVFQNKTMFVDDWFKFITISYNYMQETPYGIQRLNWSVISQSSPHSTDFDVYPYDDTL